MAHRNANDTKPVFATFTIRPNRDTGHTSTTRYSSARTTDSVMRYLQDTDRHFAHLKVKEDLTQSSKQSSSRERKNSEIGIGNNEDRNYKAPRNNKGATYNRNDHRMDYDLAYVGSWASRKR